MIDYLEDDSRLKDDGHVDEFLTVMNEKRKNLKKEKEQVAVSMLYFMICSTCSVFGLLYIHLINIL